MKQITLDGVTYNLTPVETEKKKTVTKEERFAEIISGIEINKPVVDFEKYPNSIFWLKGEECLFEYDFKNSRLWCKWTTVWSIFKEGFSMSYYDTQSFMKTQVEEHFKLKKL